jgi:hypothetical protein
MNIKKKKELEVLINIFHSATLKAQDAANKLAEFETIEWGFTHDKVDEIVEALDYARGDLTVSEFIDLMNFENEKHK